MRTSDAGREFIASHEGLRLTAYTCPAGKLTIGFGHTSAAGPPKVTRGMTITRQQADAILATDLRQFEGYVSDLVTVPLQQHEYDALVSFCFNLGPANLKRSTLLRKLNAGDRTGAANEFSKWTLAGGKRLPGLVRRRAEERNVFVHGTYPSGGAPSTSVPPIPAQKRQQRGLAGALLTILAAVVAAVTKWLGVW